MCTNRERRKSRQFLGPLDRIGEGPETVHSPLHEQLLGRIHAGPQQHVARNRPSEFVARTFDGPLIDGKAEFGCGDSEATRRRRHPQVTSKSQLRSCTHCGAVDRGERDARKDRESPQCRPERIAEFVTFDSGEIRACTEGGRLTGQHHDTGPVGNGTLMIDHGAEGQQINGIAPMRPPNGDDRHVLALPVERHGMAGFRTSTGDFLVIRLYHRSDCMTSGRPSSSSPVDPVRARRAQVAKYSLLANRIGYLLYAATIACFVLAFAIGFNSAMVTLMTIGLVGGSILLAPSIVLGYAVKAAEREDLEREREAKSAAQR